MKRIESKWWMGGALALGATMWMIPGSASADFVGPFEPCSAIAEPAALTTCASSEDPLGYGNAVIDDQGNLELVLGGAATSATYTILFRSIDGNTITLGSVSTGANGNASHSKYGALAFEKAAAGSIVLQRNGVTGDQFVTSLFVRPADADFTRADFNVDLIGCSAVNDPKDITGCGTDSFKSGSLQVNSDTGDTTIQVKGAEANTTYTVVLRTPGGTSTLALGTVNTDSKGDGSADMGVVPAATFAAGTVVLTRSGADQAYGGVRVSEKQPKSPIAGSRLVKCDAINYPVGSTPLSTGDTCGSDPLTTGSATLGSAGKLAVSLTGAAASTAYEVFFRPVNTTGSADVDTGIAVTTGTTGNGHASGLVAASGDTASGTFVVKNADVDEFFTGFTIK
jgi:hypothetical protein